MAQYWTTSKEWKQCNIALASYCKTKKKKENVEFARCVTAWMLLIQLDQPGLHILHPMSCHHDTFRRFVCHFVKTQWEKNVLTLGNCLTDMLHDSNFWPVRPSDCWSGADLAMLGPRYPLYTSPTLKCVMRLKTQVKIRLKSYSVCLS